MGIVTKRLKRTRYDVVEGSFEIIIVVTFGRKAATGYHGSMPVIYSSVCTELGMKLFGMIMKQCAYCQKPLAAVCFNENPYKWSE